MGQRYTVTRAFPCAPRSEETVTDQEPRRLLEWPRACGVAGTLAHERVWLAEYTGEERVTPWLAIPRRRG